jgi:hypothetical protein
LETPQEILKEVLAARAHLVKEIDKGASGPLGRPRRGVRVPKTLEEGLALLQGRMQADFMLPILQYYFAAMERASMENIPPWKGEPENALESLEAIDAIIGCCRKAARQERRLDAE